MHREAVELSQLLSGKLGVSQPVIDAMMNFGNVMLDEIDAQFGKIEGDSLQSALQVISKLGDVAPLVLNSLTLAGFCSCLSCHDISRQLTTEITTESTKKVVTSAKQLHSDMVQLMKDMSFGGAPEFASVRDEITKRKEELLKAAKESAEETLATPEGERVQREATPEDCISEPDCTAHETGPVKEGPGVQKADSAASGQDDLPLPGQTPDEPMADAGPDDASTDEPQEQDIPKED